MNRKSRLNRDLIPAETMRSLFEPFIVRSGRQPTLHDPDLVCWHATAPKPICALCKAEYLGVIEAAKSAGIDPAQALKAAGIESAGLHRILVGQHPAGRRR